MTFASISTNFGDLIVEAKGDVVRFTVLDKLGQPVSVLLSEEDVLRLCRFLQGVEAESSAGGSCSHE